jgi:hypothetical protein
MRFAMRNFVKQAVSLPGLIADFEIHGIPLFCGHRFLLVGYDHASSLTEVSFPVGPIAYV